MFSQRLKNTRLERGLTLEELATKCNNLGIYSSIGRLSKGTLSKYENGKQTPMLETNCFSPSFIRIFRLFAGDRY